MKLKRVFACGVCALMTFASVANAAYTTDEDGWYVADKVTKAQVEAYTPNATIDVKFITAAEAKSAGLALGKGSTALNDDNSDFYQIDLTMSQLGDLMYAYLADSDYAKEMQVRVFNASVELPDLDFKKVATTAASKYQDVAWTTSEPGNALGSLTMYWYAGSAEKAFPTRTPVSGDLEGTYIESKNAKMDTATFIIAVADGYEKTITPKLKVTYAGENDTEGQFSANAVNGVFPNGNVKIAAPAPISTPASITSATLEGKYDKGYVWTVGLKKGTGDVKSFTAKFETETDSREKSMKNPGDLTSKFNGEGTLSFNVGLLTSGDVELTKASFAVDGTAAVNAPVSK